LGTTMTKLIEFEYFYLTIFSFKKYLFRSNKRNVVAQKLITQFRNDRCNRVIILWCSYPTKETRKKLKWQITFFLNFSLVTATF
jgi:hypothetical protein